ncbi:MAG TPA: pyridoxal phosphate-dependent aminotransferase [Phycisphaerales bacterium]|nr:pyridoxal phosphate-dependent aminotransferase [Phycisphaerales bacterium]
MKISQRAQAVPPSATIAVSSRAKEMRAQGLEVVSFGAGEPDFDTPQFVKDAAIEALQKGKTGYTATPGIPELRAAIADKLRRENGLDYTPDQVIVNIGAKHSIYEALQAVIDPGDEVILPRPYWVTYPEAIRLAGGVPRMVETDEAAGYKMSADQLAAALTDKTALLILNSPNNPGGFAYDPDELAALAKVLEGTAVMVISDEIYEKLVYGDTRFISFAALSEDAFGRTLTVNGLSKAYAMTGWRVGYTAGPIEAIKAMARLQSHMTQNCVTFVQYGALAAMRDTSDTVETMRRQFEKRAAFIAERLNAIKGVRCPLPTGAFYVFPDVSAHYGRTFGDVTVRNSLDFAGALLEQAHVALVPGDPFGCPKNVRLSFACSMEQIAEGTDRIRKWLS